MVSRSLTFLFVLCVSFAIGSCELLPIDPTHTNSGGERSQSVNSTGVIVQIPLNDAIFWGIEAADGTRYEPLNLPTQFEEDGLRVRFSGELRFVATPSAGWGQTLYLEAIEKI